MTFLQAKRDNPCEICSSSDGRCRAVESVRLCMNAIDDGASPPGWRFVGQTKDGTWGKWAPDNRQEWTQQQREQWKAEQATRRQQEAHQRAEAMPAEERDRHYGRLFSQVPLAPVERADLHRRGLTDEQIAAAGFNSVEQWQRLEVELPHTLPGVSLDGRSLNVQPGLLCPIVDVEGRIVGCQVRLRDADQGGRYRWLSSKTRKRPNGQSAHLPNGENPVMVARPLAGVTNSAIGMAEGIPKPFVAAQQLGQVVIGAAGGQFTSSPQTLQQSLEKLSDELATRTIAFYPDAGSTANKGILYQYRSAWKLLDEWGYTVKVGWWEQTSKDAPDIDELTNHNQIQWLTVDQFEAIVQQGKPQSTNAGQGFKPDKASDRQRYINRRKSKFLDFWQDLKRDFRISDIRSATLYEGYAPPFELAPTIALQGWLGSGKTEATLRSLRPHRNCPIVWIAPTNGLLRQTAARAERMGFEIYHLQDDNSFHRQMLRTGHPGLHFACPDSFKPYAVERVCWKETLVVIDEFAGVREALLNKPVELPQMMTAIEECCSLIAVDAFLGDIDLKSLAELRDQPIKRYQQKFQKSQKPIKWLEGITQEGIIGLSHDGMYYPLLRQWLLNEGIRKLAIAVDSVNAARQLQPFVESLGAGLKVWLACSHTVEENHQFLFDPDRLIADQGIDILVYSPTIQSGADIQSCFERGLLIAGGVLSCKQMMQMLGRCRNCAEWFVSAPRKSINPACTTPSLDGKKVKRWGDKLGSVFAVVGVNAPQPLQSWRMWQRLVGEVEGAFSSEYLELLLHEHFESIKTVQIRATDCGQWRNDRKQLKADDAKSTLKANLQNGLRLLNEQKTPSKNLEVWDLKLADLAVKYPKVIKDVIASKDSQQEEAASSFSSFHRTGWNG